MKKASLMLAAAAACFLAAAPFSGALAQTKSALTASELQSVLTDAGLPATITEDAASGAPVAQGKIGEFGFYVRGLDCSGQPVACENFMFFVNFSVGRSLTANDLVILNRFNEGQVFGRAYFIEASQEVGVDYVVELGGGVTMEHLAKNIGRWTDVVAAFVDHFRKSQASS